MRNWEKIGVECYTCTGILKRKGQIKGKEYTLSKTASFWNILLREKKPVLGRSKIRRQFPVLFTHRLLVALTLINQFHSFILNVYYYYRRERLIFLINRRFVI